MMEQPNIQAALFDYLLRLGDNSLILGQRLSEWCGHAPELEEDIALTNIALDLIGQATNFLNHAGTLDARGRSADELAYLRDAGDFRCAALVQQPNGDFAHTLLRQYFFDAFQHLLLPRLSAAQDPELAGIAAKSLKEVKYHLRHSKSWAHRLGMGTEESHRRMQQALETLWTYTGDLFELTEGDHLLMREGIVPDLTGLHDAWKEEVLPVLDACGLPLPEGAYFFEGTRKGYHTEHLGNILAEMQFLPRAYPDAQW